MIKEMRRMERFKTLPIIKQIITRFFRTIFNTKRDAKNGIHEINRLTASFDIAITIASRNQTTNITKTIISESMVVRPQN
ncbi:MAG: hypothetical protein ACTSYM_05975 [Candidatus Baldrarchaeia archaeon]